MATTVVTIKGKSILVNFKLWQPPWWRVKAKLFLPTLNAWTHDDRTQNSFRIKEVRERERIKIEEVILWELKEKSSIMFSYIMIMSPQDPITRIKSYPIHNIKCTSSAIFQSTLFCIDDKICPFMYIYIYSLYTTCLKYRYLRIFLHL